MQLFTSDYNMQFNQISEFHRGIIYFSDLENGNKREIGI